MAKTPAKTANPEKIAKTDGRKQRNLEVQQAREAANRDRMANNEQTPWQAAQAARKARRAADPKVQARAKHRAIAAKASAKKEKEVA